MYGYRKTRDHPERLVDFTHIITSVTVIIEMSFCELRKIGWPAEQPLPSLTASLPDPNRLGIAPSLETSQARLDTDTTLLVTSERGLRADLEMSVDPDGSGLQTARHALGPLHVLAPDGATQTHQGSIGTAQDIVLIRPLEKRHNGPELLLRNQTGVLRGVVYHGGRQVEAAALLGRRGLATEDDVPPLLGDVAVQVQQLGVLHAVLRRPEDGLGIAGTAALQGLDEVHEGLEESVVDVLVDVYTLDAEADLAGVHESHGCNLFRCRESD